VTPTSLAAFLKVYVTALRGQSCPYLKRAEQRFDQGNDVTLPLRARLEGTAKVIYAVRLGTC